MRALVVEDEAVSRKMLARMLAALGFEVDEVSNGQDGLSLFVSARSAGSPYAVVCLDIGLPCIDGHAILAELRRLEAETAGSTTGPAVVLMTTGVRDGRTVARSFMGGCQAYLPKPVTLRDLTQQLQAHVDLQSVAEVGG